jgi:hypothetical protein
MVRYLVVPSQNFDGVREVGTYIHVMCHSSFPIREILSL